MQSTEIDGSAVQPFVALVRRPVAVLTEHEKCRLGGDK